MRSHTPGPWIVHEDDWGIDVRSANAADLSEAPFYYVMARDIGGHRYGEGYTDNGEVIANAKLISAAPDLLEALIAAEEKLVIAEHHLDRDEDDSISFEPEILAARAAITKARGES